MNNQTEIKKPNGLALLPFIVFVAVFMGSGIILGIQGVFKPFSQFPPLIAAYIAIIVAFALYKGNSHEKLSLLQNGIGRPTIALMVVIYALSGAFSGVAKGMGGVDSVVNLCLSIVPQKYIVMGIFMIASVVAFASGSSVGTATMVAPIALGFVETAGVPLGLTMGAVLSGGMFGNQLSPISDCTIVTVSGFNISLKEKTKYNLTLAIPAYLIATVLFMLKTTNAPASMEIGSYSILKIIPYVIVLGLSMTGVSVVNCLSAGILLAGAIGIYSGDYTLLSCLQSASNGAISMGGTILLMMFMGGIAYMVDQMGGISFIVEKLSGGSGNSARSGHLSIALLTCLIMFCVANDTVAILIICPLAKEICKKFRVDPRCAAVTVSLLAASISPLCPWSGFSFTVQGLAQQAGYGLSFVEILPVTYYPIILILFGIAAIFVSSISTKIFKKPWDFENDCVENEGGLN